MIEEYQDNEQKIEVSKSKKHVSRVLIIFIALFFSGVFFIFGFSVGKGQQHSAVPLDFAMIENKNSNDEVDFALFWDVWDLVKENMSIMILLMHKI